MSTFGHPHNCSWAVTLKNNGNGEVTASVIRLDWSSKWPNPHPLATPYLRCLWRWSERSKKSNYFLPPSKNPPHNLSPPYLLIIRCGNQLIDYANAREFYILYWAFFINETGVTSFSSLGSRPTESWQPKILTGVSYPRSNNSDCPVVQRSTILISRDGPYQQQHSQYYQRHKITKNANFTGRGPPIQMPFFDSKRNKEATSSFPNTW